MAKNLTQGNIDFTVDTSEVIGGFNQKRTHASLITNKHYNTTTKQTLIDNIDDETGDNYEAYGGFSVNAVDIDWNKAELDQSTVIHNTGELLAIIKDLKERLADAELLIRGLYASMTPTTA